MRILARMGVPLLLVGLLTACSTNALTYEQWKQEQENRLKAERAGQPYKPLSEVRKEVEDMRKAVGETPFAPATK